MQDFDTFYKEKYVNLVSMANKILNDYHISEEIVDDILIKSCSVKDEFKSDWQRLKWVVVSVRRQCLNEISKKKRLLLISDSEKIEKYANPEYQAISVEIISDIYKAIESLPPRQKNVFILHYINQKSHKEISQLTGLRMQTVKNTISFAIDKLRLRIMHKADYKKYDRSLTDKVRTYLKSGKTVNEIRAILKIPIRIITAIAYS